MLSTTTFNIRPRLIVNTESTSAAFKVILYFVLLAHKNNKILYFVSCSNKNWERKAAIWVVWFYNYSCTPIEYKNKNDLLTIILNNSLKLRCRSQNCRNSIYRYKLSSLWNSKNISNQHKSSRFQRNHPFAFTVSLLLVSAIGVINFDRKICK